MFEPESRIIRQLCIVNTTTSKTADSICEVWRRSLKQLFCGRQRFVRIIIPWFPLVWVLHGQNKLFQECFFRIIPGKLFLGVTRTLEYLFKGAAIFFSNPSHSNEPRSCSCCDVECFQMYTQPSPHTSANTPGPNCFISCPRNIPLPPLTTARGLVGHHTARCPAIHLSRIRPIRRPFSRGKDQRVGGV